jgi:hypothetical protein
VDGFTQPGSQPNTNPTGGLNAVLRIELAGGLPLRGDGSTARGLVINSGSLVFGSAISGPNVVEGCYIGTDPTGTQGLSPSSDGIRILSSGGPARVGGTLPAQRNLISGNFSGVYLVCPDGGGPCNDGAEILGNLIGTTVTGASPLPNGVGVDSLSSGHLTIGGGGSARNVISGNHVAGIYYAGSGRAGLVRILGNRIGVDDTGAVPLPNDMGIGIAFACFGSGCATAGEPFVQIGAGPETANLIARNRFEGVYVRPGFVLIAHNSIVGNANGIFLETANSLPVKGIIAANTITDNRWYGIEANAFAVPSSFDIDLNVIRDNAFDGVALNGSISASLAGNAIGDNDGLGIDLGNDGVTANDLLDQDTGPNDLMNYPAVTRACSTGGVVTVDGSLHTRPGSAAVIELFGSPTCDPSGNGEGATLRATRAVTTDAAGNAAFSIAYPGANGGFVAATATSADGDSSEFGVCFPVAPTAPPSQAIVGPSAVCAGSPFTLRATPGATAYQWFKDGVPISGAVGLAFGRQAAAPADAGSYTVRASLCGIDTTSPPLAFSVVTCTAFPLGLDVDRHAAAGTASDLNGILEPSETVVVEPRYRNVSAAALTLAGTATLAGPSGGTYALPDPTASYGTFGPGQVTDCFGATGDCYRAAVSAPTGRPLAHWDATLTETTNGGDPSREWLLHIGGTFADVPRADLFYRFIEAMVHNGVTAGCSATNYCSSSRTTREQMAVFVLVAREGRFYAPPACNPAAPRFSDVPASSPFCAWIEELARRGVVGGCGGGTYCPLANVPRDQMAVFVLATREPPGYAPPPCVANSEVFADVPASSPYCRWVEELARRSVVGGCGNGNYCPSVAVTRGEMSVFIVATFGLLLYGP